MEVINSTANQQECIDVVKNANANANNDDDNEEDMDILYVEKHFPIQDCQIVGNDFRMIVHDRNGGLPLWFIDVGGAKNTDKSLDDIMESGFYKEHVMNPFITQHCRPSTSSLEDGTSIDLF
jgi:hypothetical protein